VQETGDHLSGSELIEVTEWVCFLRGQRGDETAWRKITDTYRSRLTALALMITRSATSAEDVVQETFVRALTAQVSNTSGTVHGFLGTIAYRLSVKEARRSRRHVPLNAAQEYTQGETQIERLLRGEREQLVAEAIAALSPEHRDVLLLRFYGGHSYEEISELLDTPLGTVKSRIFYAVASCREVLKRKDYTE